MQVGALVVSYNPDIEILRQNVLRLREETDTVIIVDNGSENANSICREIEDPDNCIQVIYQHENTGIAAALNSGMLLFEKMGYQWVITMDQDSVLQPESINMLKKHINDDVGIVCPRVKYLGWPESKTPNKDIEEIESCMTSASLTSIKAWNDCKGFNEDFFIDYVDDDFCKKVRLCKYKIIRDNRCIFEHRLGDAKMLRILGKTICYSQHSPVRCYYMARNILVFNAIYKDSIDFWLETKRAVYIIGKNLLVCKPKLKVIQYTYHGIVDGIKKRMGKCRLV